MFVKRMKKLLSVSIFVFLLFSCSGIKQEDKRFFLQNINWENREAVIKILKEKQKSGDLYKWVLILGETCSQAIGIKEKVNLYLFKSYAYLLLGDTEGASIWAKKALSLSPADSLGNYILGRVYLSTAKVQKALDYFQLAEQGYPSWKETSLYKGKALYLLRQIPASAESLKLAKEKVDFEPQDYLLYASVFYELGNIKEASNILYEAREKNPGDFSLTLGLASVLAYKKEWKTVFTYILEAGREFLKADWMGICFVIILIALLFFFIPIWLSRRQSDIIPGYPYKKWSGKQVTLIISAWILLTLLLPLFLNACLWHNPLASVIMPIETFPLVFVNYVLVSIAVFLLILTLSGKAGIKELGLVWRGFKKTALPGIGAGCIAMGYGIVVILFLTIIFKFILHNFSYMEYPLVTFILTASNSWANLIFVAFTIVICAPIIEELLFRGVIYNFYKYRVGAGFGVILSGLMFGFVHLDPFRFIPLSLAGVILALVYENSGTILSSMIAHSVFNSVATALIFVIYISNKLLGW